jgi:WD40 repeat protein
LAFSGDGRRLATVRDELPTIWSTDDGSLVRELDPVPLARAAALDRTGTLLAVGTEASIRLFDVDTGGASTVMPDLPDEVGSMEFDSEGVRLAVMLEDGSVWVWNVRSGALETKYWVGRGSYRTSIAWSPDEARLATVAHTASVVRLWDVGLTQRQEVLRGHTSYVYPVVYTSDGRYLVSGSWDRTIRVWNADTGAELRVLTEHRTRITGLAAAPDSPRVAAVTDGGELAVWDVEQGVAAASATVRRTWATVAWSPDGRTIAAGADHASAEIVLFDSRTLAVQATLSGHGERVTSLAFDPAGGFLVSGGHDRLVKRWDLRANVLVEQRKSSLPVHSVCFSPDGHRIAVAGFSGQLQLWDAKSLTHLQSLHGHAREVFGAAFAPDGKRLFSGGRDGELRVWDVESGALVGQFGGHTDYIWSVSVHPDGRRVATGSGDSTVRQWESEPMGVTYRRGR